MVDVFAEVPADFCKRFAVNSPVQHVDYKSAAEILEALPPGKIISSGGGAANTAKIAAFLGIPTAFIGAVGSDPFGLLFEEELRQAGVRLHLARKKSPTGVFISLISKNTKAGSTGSSRHIVASPSAALELNAADLDEKLFECRDDVPQLLFLEGFLLDREKLIDRILELAATYKLGLAIDSGTADIAAEQARRIQQGTSPFPDRTLRAGKFPLMLFMNEKEAEAFSGVYNAGWENLFIEASKDSSVMAAVKLAERGAVIFSGGRLYRAKTKPVKAAESTGTGDAFAAGFLASWLQNNGPLQCGQAGNTAAAMVLKAPGTG